LHCPKSTQVCTRSRAKVGSRSGCAPASPASSCPGWRRSLPGSSTWSARRGSSWPPLCSSQRLRSKSGSRTDASSGANRVWSSSRPNWPNWAWLPRRKAPDLRDTQMKATRMRSSLTRTWTL
ncbi:hypothetical protein INR49_002186, partial [Caranx melampygus]